VTFDLYAADISQPLLCQAGARGLHDQTGIERAALSGFEVKVTQDPAAFMRPRYGAKGGEVRHGQHVAAPAHRLAAEAAIGSKDILEDAVGRIHREKRGRKRYSVPCSLREQPCLDRSHSHDTVRIDTSDPYDLQIFFVDPGDDLRQPLPALW
jgi:hypothetical protein